MSAFLKNLPVANSDCDVFLKMMEVHGYIGVKSYFKTLLYSKTCFLNFEPLVAIRAFKFKKKPMWPKNFSFTKFEYGYKNNSEFYADFETVKKNAKHLNKKVIGKRSVQNGVCPLLYYRKSG